MFSIFVVWAFFHSQTVEVAQMIHLYEAHQLLCEETQDILAELIEKQKFYLPGTVDYQYLTELIDFTKIVIELQKTTFKLFKSHYLFSVDQVNVLLFKYVIVVRILMLVLFGLGFLVLVYKAYQSSNIKK